MTAASDFREVVRHGQVWLPVLGVTALLGSAVTLALPTVLGRSVDAIVAQHGYGSWFAIAAGLVAVGIVCSLVDVFSGTACVASTTASSAAVPKAAKLSTPAIS